MKTKHPLQTEPEWQEEEMRVFVSRLFQPAWPEPAAGSRPDRETGTGRKVTSVAPGRHRSSGPRRARGFTMPASDASLWLDEIEGG